jgi:hypothetical protein
MIGPPIATSQQIDDRCDPVSELVYLPQLQRHFPDHLAARNARQWCHNTVLMRARRRSDQSVGTFRGASQPLQPIQTPIACRLIRHRPLIPAVSYLEAYSTPAR